MKFAAKISKPILEPIGFPFLYYPGNWQSRWVYHPSIITQGKKIFLFYSGKSGINMLGKFKFQMRQDIGLAQSNDLKNWQRLTDPILSPSKKAADWDSDLVCHSFVLKKGKQFFMLYDGSKKNNWHESIGLALSNDLKNWHKYPQNPIFKSSKNYWERNHVSRCSVIFHKGEYYLFYAGHDGKRERIGLAKGKTLTDFKRVLQDPILDPGKKGQWDSRFISDPKVIKVGNQFLMSYTGFNSKDIKASVGIAYSADLINWKKFPFNPILTPGPEGTWDQIEAARADLVKIFNQYYLFYTGSNGFKYSIGLAKVNINKILKIIKNEY